jgi:hypothetical protein
MIEPQARIARPSVPFVIPESVDRLCRMERAERVGPALIDQPSKRRPALRLHQSVLVPRLRRIDIPSRRNDVVIASQHHREARGQQSRCVGNQSLEPGQLVGEFRPRLRVAVWQIDAADQDAAHGGLDVAGLRILGVPGQLSTGEDRICVAGENRDAVPRPLTPPHRAVSSPPQDVFGKRPILDLQLLQADDVRLTVGEPSKEVLQSFVDIVDVERGDLQDFHSGGRPSARTTSRRSGHSTPALRLASAAFPSGPRTAGRRRRPRRADGDRSNITANSCQSLENAFHSAATAL